eukprot:TRINITY_DN64386_c0_g1_i1.p1 TRINITY_DN64386_c0_g1~~TRINITY_DN64386_c0_g1_i1.p1  ORF type:complete len:177 (+),score=41.88 TRINITY_DN64386_c0_g1_i1:69-533(+)
MANGLTSVIRLVMMFLATPSIANDKEASLSDFAAELERANTPEKMFEIGDVDKDGELSVEEVIELAKADDPQQVHDQDMIDVVRSDVADSDKDKNGKLSLVEFTSLMTSYSEDETEAEDETDESGAHEESQGDITEDVSADGSDVASDYAGTSE